MVIPGRDNFNYRIKHLSSNLKVPILDIKIRRSRLTILHTKVPTRLFSEIGKSFREKKNAKLRKFSLIFVKLKALSVKVRIIRQLFVILKSEYLQL